MKRLQTSFTYEKVQTVGLMLGETSQQRYVRYGVYSILWGLVILFMYELVVDLSCSFLILVSWWIHDHDIQLKVHNTKTTWYQDMF